MIGSFLSRNSIAFCTSLLQLLYLFFRQNFFLAKFPLVVEISVVKEELVKDWLRCGSIHRA